MIDLSRTKWQGSKDRATFELGQMDSMGTEIKEVDGSRDPTVKLAILPPLPVENQCFSTSRPSWCERE